MNNTKTFVALIVIAIIAISGLIFPRGNTVVQRVTEKLGANSGPESTNDYQCYNRVCYHYRRIAVRTASSTLCTIKSPPATTTIAHLSSTLNTTASYATQYLWGHTTTGNNATTTSLASIMAVAANAKLVYVASSTVNDNFTGTTNYGAVPPSTYLNFNLSTSTAGASAAYAPAGFCTAVFREL